MPRDHDVWQFIAERLARGEAVILLTVADSQGSSPGRAGYKMAVAADGELMGSIGGGIMEVNLVELARNGKLNEYKALRQVHRRNSENASGMICSGEQTVILKHLDA